MKTMGVPDPDLVASEHGDAVEAGADFHRDAFDVGEVTAREHPAACVRHGVEFCERVDFATRQARGLKIATGRDMAENTER